MAPSAPSKGEAVECPWVLHGVSEGRIQASCSALKPSHIQTPSHRCPHIPSLGWAHLHPRSTPHQPSEDASTPESSGTLAFSTLESTIHREVGLKVSFR